MLTAVTLVLGSDLSSWTMWNGEGMRQTWMTVPTTKLVSITVITMKMQE